MPPSPWKYPFLAANYDKNLETNVFHFLELTDDGFFVRTVGNRQNLQGARPIAKLERKLLPGETTLPKPRLVDLDGDDSLEPLVLYNGKTPAGRYARGVACFDMETGILHLPAEYTSVGAAPPCLPFLDLILS